MFCFEQIVWSPLQGVILLLSKPGGRRIERPPDFVRIAPIYDKPLLAGS